MAFTLAGDWPGNNVTEEFESERDKLEAGEEGDMLPPPQPTPRTRSERINKTERFFTGPCTFYLKVTRQQPTKRFPVVS
jgi:hypothetical protein